MRKPIFLFCTLLFSNIAFSQTFLAQDFSEGIMPPTGWTIDNLTNQWNCNMTSRAEGEIPEARISYRGIVGTSRLISPQVNMNGETSVTVSFKHFLRDWAYQEDYLLGVATRSGGGDWATVWQVETIYNLGPEEQLVLIENDDVGASDFQFCIYIDGNLNHYLDWYIDDISLYRTNNLDGEMQSINTYPFVIEPTLIEGTVYNKGTEPITSVEISWQADDQQVYTSSFSGLTINTGETYDFTCPDIFNYPVGTYELNVWLTSVNGVQDEYSDNDLLSKTVSVVSHTVYKRPIFEQFAGSYSVNANLFNNSYVPWLEEHDDSLTHLRYPRAYDPYFTDECDARENYYVLWINDFPYTYGNGEEVWQDFDQVLLFYEYEIQEPGFANIVSSRSSVSRGTVMDIDVTILPFANFDSHSLIVAVFENTTTGNVGNNGETEFKHVLMKMVPDAFGTEVFLSDREPVTISQSIDLAGTNIEEWDDLGVVVFIQDLNSREIFQSTYAIENANFASDATLSELNVNGSLIAGFSPDILEYNIELPYGTTVVPEVTGIPTDENATVVVIPANELPGTTTVEVFAEDLITKLMYVVNFSVIAGFEDPAAIDVKVYPNPTSGVVNINGVNDATIEVYTISGQLIERVENSSGYTINLASQQNGIYIVKVLEDGFVINKKIILSTY